ncbi:S1C family serine protease [Pseudalkalibacillus caeni]|uniref:Serine protease n=1 Tax=Exobacillus caeni TaxID=2574798 RepID=A0A5R9F4F7_9BACL|nr:S1C family serine protease [Pseudalkalibacillus caeni]TLS37290.1 serine protease [Pseudalkalibacillus caeni]
MNKAALVSITATILLFLAAGTGFYFLYTHYENLTVQASSTLGRELSLEEQGEIDANPDLKSIIHETQKSVVQIEVTTSDGKNVGSGFLYNEKGDVITNAHVVSGASEVTVKTSDAKQFSGQVIGKGETDDVALVRVPDLAGQEPLAITKERLAETGDEVIALGSPLGLQNTVTTGIISGTDREFTLDPYRYEGVYQISAPITNGNSGGPLIDQHTGEAVAINSAGTDSGAIGFSIPLPNVLDKIENWASEGTEVKSEEPEVEEDTTEEDSSTRGLTGEDFENSASYLIGYFYESLDTRDYLTAYSLLGSRWQSEMGYENFREGYLHTLGVRVTNLTGKLSEDRESVLVTGTVEAEERTDDKKTVTSLYSVNYEVAYENDQLKILHGKAKRLK